MIGVLPRRLAFDHDFTQIWRPLILESGNMTRNYRWLTSFALLKRDVTLEQARAQMDSLGAQIAAAHSDSNKDWGVRVERLAEMIFGPCLRRTMLIFVSAAGMVLLIGCANLANLLMARASSREHEVALRASLGAGRRRLVRQFLTENILLSICRGALGIGIGYAGLAAVPPLLPRQAEVAMDGCALLFALTVSVFTGVLFGLAPAIRMSRPDLTETIKEGMHGGTAGSRSRHLSRGLVVAEIALAFILLTGAGLRYRCV